MAADERLSSIASEQAFKELEQLKSGLKEVVDGLLEANKVAKSLEIGLKGAKDIKEHVIATNMLVDAHGNIVTATSKVNAKYKESITLIGQLNGKSKETVQVQQEIIKLDILQERLAKAKTKSLNDQNDAYGKLNKQYNEAARNAQNLATQYGIEDARAKAAAKSANELGNQLKAIDATVGKSQRNVGNYKSATDGLGFSIRTIAGELPNLGISFRTFAQSVSNNIGPLSEAIKEARKQNALLVAEGKPTVSIGRQIASSIFNWQTAILAAVAAITYLVSNMKKSETATDKAEKANKKYADSLNSIAESERNASQEEIAHIAVLTTIAADTTATMKNRERAVRDLQKAYPDYFGNLDKEIILQGKAADAINEATSALLARASAQAAEKRFAAASEQVYDLQLALKGANEEIDKQQKLVDRNKNNPIGFTSVEANRRLKEAGQNYQNIAKALNEARTAQLDFLEDARKSAKEAGQTIFEKDPKEAKGVDPSKLAAREKKRREKEAKDRQKELDDETKLTLTKVKANYEQRLAIAKDAVQDEKRSLDERLVNVDKALLDETSIVKLNGAIQHKTREEIEADITEVVLKYARLRQQIIDTEGKQEAEAIKKNLEGLSKGAGNKQGQTRGDFDKSQADRLKSIEDYTQKSIQFSQSLASVNSSITERRIRELDAEKEAVERLRDREIELIEKSQGSAIEKERKIAEARARADAKITEIENARRKRLQRAAQFEKGITIAQIIAETALAVVRALGSKPYTPANIGLAIATGAVGAGALAAAIAAPLPQYEEGTKGKPHKGGPAVLFEGNKPELVLENDKAWVGSQEGVYNLSKGAEVISNKELLELSRYYTLGLPALRPQTQQSDNGELLRTMVEVKEAIKSKKETVINLSGLGLWHLEKIGNTVQNRLHNIKH